MKLDFVEPFVDATLQVLGRILGSEVRPGEVALVRAPRLNGDHVCVVIAIRDDRAENIILTMKIPTALGICGALNGTTFETMTVLGYDTLGEVANMIAGSAVSLLKNRGFDLKVLLPEVIDGEQVLRITDGLELFQIPVISEFGEIRVNVTMRTN